MNKLYAFHSHQVNMPKITSQPPQGKKILEQVGDAIRLKH
jgi:hypothetical protein